MKACGWLSVVAIALISLPAQAETLPETPSKLPVPRWAMLRKNKVFARNGPSKENRTLWTYRAASLPVQIISETREWRLVCDPAGGVAWVSRTMLQAPRTVMTLNPQKLEMRANPDDTSTIKASLRPNAIAQLGKCKKDFCKISADGQSGWVPKKALWGTQTAPVCKRPNLLAGN